MTNTEAQCFAIKNAAYIQQAHPKNAKDAMSTKLTSRSLHADVRYVREKLGISSACTDWQVRPGESYRLRIERRPLIEPERWQMTSYAMQAGPDNSFSYDRLPGCNPLYVKLILTVQFHKCNFVPMHGIVLGGLTEFLW